MRKIIVQEMLSVDGFFCGPNGEIDWHNVDAEFNKTAVAFLDTLDTLLFGRVTYELMASYWPTEAALTDDPHVASRMNALHKVYFSKEPEKMPWNNSTMLGEINADEIRKMKEAPGKDIAIFGSGKIIEQLMPMGVIDEFRFMINPVILGKGRTIFSTLEKTTKLKLLRTKEFTNGNVLLEYAAHE
ncbi:MAG: dihydrofolate reductase family protein [Patescibacteria group bacterium]